jgi:hypothetical protein
MQTLIFNTTTKLVKFRNDSDEVTRYENVSTVKCSELGFYEVMQKVDDGTYNTIPVFRAPIANTNMIIEK